MKNNAVKALALLLSINCCFPGMLVKAEAPKDEMETPMELLLDVNLESLNNQSKILQKPLGITELPRFDSNDIPSLLEYQANSGKEEGDEAEHLTEVSNEEKIKENVEPDDTGLKQLRIPQKLDVIIDPWEMDGKGQIYSEQYVIRNDGEAPGILTLSNLACKVSEQSGAMVTTNREGLHDGDEKLIYMLMIFGNGDQVDLSEDGSTYHVELQPGEELSIGFEGEVNEYASEGWQDGDVVVTVAYSWDMKQTFDAIVKKEEVSQDIKSENNVEETKELQEGEEATKNKEIMKNGETIQSQEEDEKTEEKDFFKVIELKEFKPIEFVIDKWESDEDGNFSSGQCLVKNEGEIEGVFVLSNLLYTDEEQNGIDVLRGEEVNGSERKPFHMELVLENGEKIDITQKVLEENLEERGCKVILKPGEEFKFKFAGVLDDVALEEFKKGNIILKVIGSWNREERNTE